MCETVDHNNEQTPISLLSDIEKTRLRPAMYIGSADQYGVLHLLYEVIGNSVEEIVGGHGNQITIILHDNKTVSVEDNGRGIPLDDIPRFTNYIDSRSRHPSKKYGVGIGPGLCAVNALCSSLIVDIHRDGFHYGMQYSRGIATGEMQILEASDKHGTTITIIPDTEIFKLKEYYQADDLSRYLCMIACLNPNLTISFVDLTGKQNIDFHYPTGITELLHLIDFSFTDSLYARDGYKALIIQKVSSEKTCCEAKDNNIFYGCLDEDGIRAEIALKYCMGSGKIFSFINSMNIDIVDPDISVINDMGYDVRIFMSTIEHILLRHAAKLSMDIKWIPFTNAIKDLCSVISLRIPYPTFIGSTRNKLQDSEEIKVIVQKLTSDIMSRFCEVHPELVINILQRIIESIRSPESWPVNSRSSATNLDEEMNPTGDPKSLGDHS